MLKITKFPSLLTIKKLKISYDKVIRYCISGDNKKFVKNQKN